MSCNRSLRSAARLVLLSTLVATGSLAIAGPLNPPAGPVGSTHKTLTEVEPRTAINATNTPGLLGYVYSITQPGTYYLTSNIQVPSGLSGISIGTEGVTIDMNGFRIQGLNGSLDGISTQGATRSNIVITNGSVVTMGRDGIAISPSSTSGARHQRIERVSVEYSGQMGIRIANGIIRDCNSSYNGSSGIYVAGNYDSLVLDSVVHNNGSNGMTIIRGSVKNCRASFNAGSGINVTHGVVSECAANNNETGIFSSRAIVESCVVRDNTVGIIGTSAAYVHHNSIDNSQLVVGSFGIQVMNEAGCRVENNTIQRAETGIRCFTAGNYVVSNTLRSCTTAVNAIAGNRIGTILTGTSSGAINGNSGGGLGTTDPYANILY